MAIVYREGMNLLDIVRKNLSASEALQSGRRLKHNRWGGKRESGSEIGLVLRLVAVLRLVFVLMMLRVLVFEPHQEEKDRWLAWSHPG